jgi:hypothetical protein
VCLLTERLRDEGVPGQLSLIINTEGVEEGTVLTFNDDVALSPATTLLCWSSAELLDEKLAEKLEFDRRLQAEAVEGSRMVSFRHGTNMHGALMPSTSRYNSISRPMFDTRFRPCLFVVPL